MTDVGAEDNRVIKFIFPPSEGEMLPNVYQMWKCASLASPDFVL